MRSPRILFVVDSASQLRPAWVLASELATELGGSVQGNVVPGSKAVSADQVSGAGIDCELSTLPIGDLVRERLQDVDVVVAMLTGSSLFGLRRSVEIWCAARPSPSRPLLVCGYNGLVYEKQLEGLLWRIGYDIVCVNSAADERRFQGLLGDLGVPSDPLVCSGLLVARGETPVEGLEPPANDPGDVRTLLFATQAVVPRGRAPRAYLLERLSDYAWAHPDRRVWVKPRTRPGETSFHRERYPYEDLYRKLFRGQGPGNLEFVYGPLSEYLPTVDVVVSVSSTAAMEALSVGCRAAILTDVGLSESLGNHFFAGSGLLCSMDDLIVDRVPRLRVSWARGQGLLGPSESAAVSSRVRELLEQAQSEGGLPFRECYFGPRRTPFLHESWLTSSANVEGCPPVRPDFLRSTLESSSSVGRRFRKLLRRPGRFFADAFRSRGNSQ